MYDYKIEAALDEINALKTELVMGPLTDLESRNIRNEIAHIELQIQEWLAEA